MTSTGPKAKGVSRVLYMHDDSAMADMIDLRRTGDRLRRARATLAKMLEEAEAAAVRTLAEGVSESAVARELGVDRMTVRKWAGKR